MRLAGTYHPISYLLYKIPLYIPGVEEVHALWMDHSGSLRSTYSKDIAQGENKVMFQKWRNQSFKSMWVESFDPFQSAGSQIKQMSLEDEDNLTTLLLSFKSVHDVHNDLIAISFPKNLFLKNFNLSFAGISAQEKLVLSNLLSSILHTEYEQCIQEQRFLSQLSNHSLYNKNKAEMLEEQLKTSEQLYSSAIYSILSELLDEISNDLETCFILEKELVKHFAKEKVNLSSIKEQINEIATIAYHLNFGSKEIRLDTSYVHAISSNEKPINKGSNSSENEDKVLQLLNRYEEAANKIEANQGVLNAKEIAKRLDPPVTPPAITDAVKKNKRKISYFLRQYPGRWKLTRQAIRPIQRIDSSQNSSNFNISS